MINHVVLRGFVADEPLIRSTENGRFARLRMATIERLTNSRTGLVREHTEWHTVALFGEAAIIADEQVRAGTPIEIEGALRTREWADRKGVRRKTTEISASKIVVLKSIEGYDLPQAIQDAMPVEYPKSIVPPSQYEVKAPTADPDDLPF